MNTELQQYYESLKNQVADTSALDGASAAADRADAQSNDAASEASVHDAVRSALTPAGKDLDACVAAVQTAHAAATALRDRARDIRDGALETVNRTAAFSNLAPTVSDTAKKADEAVKQAVAADPLESAAATQKDTQTAVAEAGKAAAAVDGAHQAAVAALNETSAALAQIESALGELEAAAKDLYGDGGAQAAMTGLVKTANDQATSSDKAASVAADKAADAAKKRDDLQAAHDSANAELQVVNKALAAAGS